MTNNYTFIDASGATQTAASSVVAGAQQPLVQVSSIPAISGTVAVTQGGAFTASVVGGVSILGGTVSLAPTSIAALQGTNPWITQMVGSVVTVWQGSSILAGLTSTNASVVTTHTGVGSVQVISGTGIIGSIATLQGTNPWISQIVSSVNATNYAIRNDTVASTLGVDLTARTVSSDSAGRILFKPFAANEASIFGHSSTVNSGDAASVLLIGAAGAGLKNYITDYQITNTGSVATLVTFTEGGASIIGRTIAPASGGSNMPGMAWPMSNIVPNQPINMVSGTASSVLYVVFRGYKAP